MTLVSPGTLTAFAVVSTIPWAATVALPRFTAAIGWLLCLALLAVAAPPEPGMRNGARPFRETGFELTGQGSSPAERSVAFAVYPPALIGAQLPGAYGVLALPAVVLAIVSMGCALAWVRRQDIPLEAAQ
jgi:hypothetical protein